MDAIMQAQQLMEENNSEEALRLLELHLKKANDEEQFTIAELYLQWGFLQEASNILSALLQRYPDESELKVMLGDIYIELEQDENAIDLLNDIEEKDTAYIQSLLQLADLYQAQGLFEVAEHKLLAAKQLEPDEPIIDFALGELSFSIGKYNNAITFYEKLLPASPIIANVTIVSRLAEAHAAIGNYEEALTYYQKEDIEDPDTLFKYGYTANQANRKDIAIKAWEKVVEIDPHYQSVYYELAKVYKEEGMVNEALTISVKGIENDEFNKELYYFAGVLAHQLNQKDESKTYAYKAIALDPEYKEAILFLIELLKEQDEFEEIRETIELAKESGALDPIYEWELARAYNELENFSKALTCYNEAYPHFKNDAEFLKEFGYFLVEDGKIETAIPILKAYLIEEPLDDEVEAYLERLQ
ncbi:tetratricopeptide repeat protein [Virgibacillus sp. W0181]|uniref:tetratricopeptide repeat protein n=1 Tax=Virgibacillus sp. W0181 TaxID=3391581 RepID=UPI003F4579CB